MSDCGIKVLDCGKSHLPHHAEGCLDELVEVLVRKSRKFGARIVTELQLHDLSMALHRICQAAPSHATHPAVALPTSAMLLPRRSCAAHQLFIDAVARTIVVANLPIWTCRQ